MYFASRTDAGKKLAAALAKYRFEDCAIIALNDGGVVVGAQIAAELHCPLMLLLMGDIVLPGERDVLGVVDQNGGFTHNDMYSAGELEAFEAEYHTMIEQQKMEQWKGIHALLGDGGILDESIAANRTILLVSDGIQNGVAVSAALNFLKSVHYTKVVAATPLATGKAADAMQQTSDESHVLSTMREPFTPGHYYKKDDIPSHENVIEILNTAILHWK